MAPAEAEELGRFRVNLERASLEELAPIIASSLDELITVIRNQVGSNFGVEIAAALSAELHKRKIHPTAHASRVGHS